MAIITPNSDEKPLVLVASVPCPGHFLAMKAIAIDLVKRGYDVTFLCAASFKSQAAVDGVKFIPFTGAADWDMETVYEMYPEGKTLPPGPIQLMWEHEKMFINPIPDYLKGVQEFLEKAEASSRSVVFLRDACFMGLNPIFLNALALRPIAHICIGNLPVFFESVDTASFNMGVPPDSSPEGRIRNKAMADGARQMFKPVNDAYETVLKQFPITEKPDFYIADMGRCCDVFLQCCIEEIEYPRSDLPNHFKYVGRLPWVYPPDLPLPSFWDEITAHKKKTIVVTQGTIALDPKDLIIPTLEGLKDMDALVIATLVQGDTIEGYTPPANARIAKYIPFDKLLPYTDIMISNGGYGSIQQAFGEGIPMVLSGMTQDKPECCARAAWTGAAINLAVQTVTPAQVKEAIGKIMDDGSYKKRAMELKEAYTKSDSLEAISQTIEELVAANKMSKLKV